LLTAFRCRLSGSDGDTGLALAAAVAQAPGDTLAGSRDAVEGPLAGSLAAAPACAPLAPVGGVRRAGVVARPTVLEVGGELGTGCTALGVAGGAPPIRDPEGIGEVGSRISHRGIEPPGFGGSILRGLLPEALVDGDEASDRTRARTEEHGDGQRQSSGGAPRTEERHLSPSSPLTRWIRVLLQSLQPPTSCSVDDEKVHHTDP
jgi:hypothetical protein